MPRQYITFLACEDWYIYTWDPVQQRVLSYNTELWGEWGSLPFHYDHDFYHVSVMAPYLDRHTPSTFSEEESDRHLLWLDRQLPGIAAAVRSQARD